MNRRSIPISSFLVLLLAVCLLLAPAGLAPHQAARADVGEVPEPGGLIMPGDKNGEIRMQSERVVFSVRPNDGVFPSPEARHYAHVVAEFGMTNLTARAVTKTLFFPLHATYDAATFESAERLGYAAARNVVVRVGDREAALTYRLLDVSAGEPMLSAVFEATFPASAETPIHVEYDLRAVHEPKRSSVSFEYMMQTGSHWAGAIGNGQVIFEFWKPVDSAVAFNHVDDFFRFVGGKLVWEFADLEPGPAQDITVTFEPAVLEAWAARPAYIRGLLSSDPPRAVPYGALRPGFEDSAGSWLSSLASLLDAARPEGGWAIQPAGESGVPWLQLDLDRAHTLLGLRIRTGVLDYAWDAKTGARSDAYDTLRRPRTVAISLSGGPVQTATLADKPAEWQIIPLPGQATTRVRLTFLDSYAGLGRGDQYLGVGRIELLGVDAGGAVACGGPNLLSNGDFELGLSGEGTGPGWSGFNSSGGADYTFSADSWPAAVHQGQRSQLIAISTHGLAASADRYAGIYQLLEGLEPGAEYELSLAGLLREEAAHPGEDRYRYRVQWALAPGQPDWTQVSAWQELPWDAYSLRTRPGAWSTTSTRLLGPGRTATLFLRVWKKWPTSGREVDLNLDDIALRRCP